VKIKILFLHECYQPTVLNNFTLEKFMGYSNEHLKYLQSGDENGRYIVGVNNLGDVSFNGFNLLKHKLWWWNDNNRTVLNAGNPVMLSYPQTIHEIDMSASGGEPTINQR
jgi:hypothetical protein